MASRGKNSGKGKGVASSSSGTGVCSFFRGRLFRKNQGSHSKKIPDNNPNIDMAAYDHGLDDQLSDDDVEEIPPT